MIEITGNKYDKLLSEVAVNLHCQEKLLNDLCSVKKDTTYSDVQNARKIAIRRYREEVVFNRRVKSMVNSVIQSLDIRVN